MEPIFLIYPKIKDNKWDLINLAWSLNPNYNIDATYYKFKTNCIVIDFGTATTFDVIKKPGIYDGGVITPGIALSIENLFSNTALLPMFKLEKYPSNYGKNTIVVPLVY